MSRVGAPFDEYVTEAALAKYEFEVAEYQTDADRTEVTWSGAAELARVERKLAEAYDGWKADRLSSADYFTMRADLDADRARLRREQSAWSTAQTRADAEAAGPVDMRAAWSRPPEEGGMTLVAKREFLFRQLLAVEVASRCDPVTGKRRRGFDPDLVGLVWREEPATPGHPDTGEDMDEGEGGGVAA